MPCLRPHDGIELEVGGGKAEFAAALGAVDHLGGNEPGRAQEFGRLHHLALAQRHADRAGGHRAALVLERRHDVDGKAEAGALLGQIGRRAGALVAEMEIEADRRAADAEASDQNALDEILRATWRRARRRKS